MMAVLVAKTHQAAKKVLSPQDPRRQLTTMVARPQQSQATTMEQQIHTMVSRIPQQPIPHRRHNRRPTTLTTISGATVPVGPAPTVVVAATTTASGAVMATTIKFAA